MTDKLEAIARIIQPNAWPDDSSQMKAAKLTAQKVLDALATTAQDSAGDWVMVPREPTEEMTAKAVAAAIGSQPVEHAVTIFRTLNTHEIAVAFYRAMIAAAPSLAGSGWRPIESAPTDKAILGWRPSNLGDDSVFVITSIDAQWSVDDGKFEHWLRGPMPTHWQPLPPPPTKDDAG